MRDRREVWHNPVQIVTVPPPFRAEPMEAKKKEKGKEYTCRKEIPYLEQKVRKRKSEKKIQKVYDNNLQVSLS